MTQHLPQPGQGADSADRRRAQSFVGRVISQRYRIDEILATGGMATVYGATHVHMHKRIAVKILHPSIEQLPGLVSRFEREAIAGAHIQHPNVAAATDFGEIDRGSYFLVLEYVEGTTLAEILRRGPVPVPRAIHIARQLAAALEATHAMGIVHRDVKPLNIMVGERQRDVVKLIDYGFAKVPVERLSAAAREAGGGEPARAGWMHQTMTGVVFGTLAYISPEAASGMDAVDARSDLYAMGLIFYEMLAGRHPFLAKDPVELFNQQVRARPPSFAQHAPGVRIPPELERVVMRLLEKDPAVRFQSAGAVIAALDEAAAWLGISRSSDSYSAPAVAFGPPPGVPSFGQPPSAPPLAIALPPPRGPHSTDPGTKSAWRPDRLASYFVFAVLAVGVLFVALNLKRARSHETAILAAPLPAMPAVTLPAEEEPVQEPADREALVEAVKAKQWDIAADVLLMLLTRDPAAFGDRSIAAAAREAAAMGTRAGDERTDKIFHALAHDAGSPGLDILYDIVATRGRSAPAERAAALLRDAEIGARATPELRIAFQLRDASCKEKQPLLGRAVQEGDRRALVALDTVVRFCFRPDNEVVAAAGQLRERLKQR